jgi:periplasmic protein TonB
MKTLCLLIVIFISTGLFSQKDTTTTVYEITEVMPEFPGGQAKLYEFLNQNLILPKLNTDSQIQGKIYVKFVIKKDGSIDDIQVIKGSHEKLNEEVIRVIKLMPKWTPGLQNGQAVDVYFTLPVQIHWN